ncbi:MULTISPECIES: hypothetical protein [unclassified Spirosoma]|uniref:hypothetical protein n=1 Tax=unclassified Spirosoma TaxID=2621999 RepID=UPI0009678736|nr:MULTISPECIES: hypothetical protein [unclassified Spirosoma]MBN8823783.1 hypothetical protein [Spirosoma sp.]OJW79817.1 MAG: hypothetical protein BGO59_00785 [Spirosoma sp. 48-14]
MNIPTRLIVEILLPIISCLFLSNSYAQQGNPPPCTDVQQVTIATDSIKQKILFEFIQNCVKEQWFNTNYDKGIVHLYEFHNSENKLCWILSATIDDIYKNNPPLRFSDFRGDIILVYDADSTGRVVKTTADKAVLNRCLEQIIGDRVFTRPTTRRRWTSDVLPYINRKRNEGNRRFSTGGGGSTLVIFEKDGTYKLSRFG